MKPVILTGIRANNDLHIGNYFGAMLPMIDMAKRRSDEYDIHMFIPDLHSFTTPIDHSQLQASIMNNARVYVAAGLPLDNPSIHLYRQSYIPAHSELTVLLNNFVGMGEMERMTQYKDKSAKLSNDRVSVGLFDYPVLMASDILLYNAKYIPVGDDQTQHLEITRDIAERMNGRFGELFTVPEPVTKQHEFFGKEQGLRIKDLVDPSKKMSKSDDTGKGVVFLSDTPDEARKKIMSATTDDKASVNYDKENQPGISNLIDILALLRGVTPAEVAAEYQGMDRYGDFKKIVADEMAQFLTDFQSRLTSLDDASILAKLEDSERAMNEVANTTLHRVQKAVGLRA
ncbi:tryptophan--tRNA ligase [Candidatus Saccharibacteria bacterium]|nr:tryptophan--tRNA ligase [Candidatus Saccharibacteria bacterium]